MAADIVHKTQSFPPAMVGASYEVALAYTGNATQITASSVASGSLPPGLVLDTAAPFTRITGTPTVNGLYTFTIGLTDTAGTSVSPPLQIRVITAGIDDWRYLNAAANVAIEWPQA